ncbi:methyl-accepting chemotaxis protein [Tissierella pigra]|uniref:Methyl-accepting transducer domain-containing protein n=1 Tax=Tissierella pigra TaxID=2607614 RepID=A0A6N7XIZ3_9FIRM|nr:methyl-accepting chemotaxis protein [Tissierella pigra]MSU02051.1 hypothetical protein [Tissierella pigra]
MKKGFNVNLKYLSLSTKLLISILTVFLIVTSFLVFVGLNSYVNIAINTEKRNLENVNNISVDALTSASRASNYIKTHSNETSEELEKILSAENYIKGLSVGKEGFFVAFNNKGQIKLHSNMEQIDKYGFKTQDGYALIYDDILSYALENTPKTEKTQEFQQQLIGEESFIVNGEEHYARIEKWEDLYIASILDEYSIRDDAKKEVGKLLVFLILIIIISSVVFIYLIKILIGNKMKVIRDNIQKFGHGNFEDLKEMKSIIKDEIFETNEVLVDSSRNMLDIMKTLGENSEDLLLKEEELQKLSGIYSTGSKEIVAAVDEIASGSEKQADETMRGLEELNELKEIIDEERQGFKLLNSKVEDIDNLKREGNEIIDDLVEYTNRSNNSAIEVQKVIGKSNLSANKIEEASIKIREIADQTNLLALNASIEAARVGEHGKGFSVVASEIRKLAEESTSFAMEIGEIIKELLSGSENAVDLIKEVREEAKKQTGSVEKTGEKFQRISEEIEDIKIIINNLNEQGNILEGKKEEITEVIEYLSAIAQENNSNTEEVCAKVEEQNNSILVLEDLSKDLKKVSENLANKLKMIYHK